MTNGYACPACRAELPEDLLCSSCDSAVEVRDGIPVFIAVTTDQKAEQAAFFDEATDEEFEIERPRGQPRFYEWLLRWKFQRAVEGLPLAEMSALVFCGGSGMDAEFLARAGASVITSDVSIGAARRARERARRHHVEYDVIVADVERLPFADESIDVVYVHDGLHHIEDPYAGLREMARVAHRAVCVTEPADAALTAAAVKAGFALEREEAGNRVARLRLAGVRRALELEGFRTAHASRYAMFYRHEPGPAMRLASLPAVRWLAISGFEVLNRMFGRLGNKLVVQASRK